MKPLSFTPQNTILLFDLHQVLFAANYIAMCKASLKHLNLVRLLRPNIIKKTVHLLWNKGSGQELLIFLEEQYPHLADAATGIVSISNAQTLVPAMHTLVQELKNKGYELHIASNIGETFFHDLKKQYPNFFALFDYIKVVTCQKDSPIIRKPMSEFFIQYQHDANPHNKQILFIDDKPMHVHTAHTLGFTSILFNNSKQLRELLHKKGIL